MGVDPVTLALAGMAVSTVVAGASTYMSTSAQRASAQYEAKVQSANAQIAERQARDAEARGRLEEDTYRKRAGVLEGQQRAALAGTGVQLGTGSALDIRRDTDMAGDLDALVIQQNAAREAYGIRLQGASATANAGLASMRASSSNAGLATGLTLLGTGSEYASRWYGAKVK